MLIQEFAKFVRNTSLNLIDIWFSSDRDRSGGFRPGDLWFDKIREKIHTSSAIIVILTPNSLSSNWVLFESGVGAALADKKLMVLTHGLESITDLPGPLSFWQAHRIDKKESLREFCEKLFEIYEVKLDDLLFGTYSDAYLKASLSPKEIVAPEGDERSLNARSDLAALTEHFDKRFFEMASLLKLRSPYISYNIVVTSNFDRKVFEVEVMEEMSLQDLFNEIYLLVSEHVEPYTYMEKWILVNETTRIKMVVREVADSIPARFLFVPGSRWIATKLKSPYHPSESNSKHR
jgi:hypothetical protein